MYSVLVFIPRHTCTQVEMGIRSRDPSHCKFPLVFIYPRFAPMTIREWLTTTGTNTSNVTINLLKLYRTPESRFVIKKSLTKYRYNLQSKKNFAKKNATFKLIFALKKERSDLQLETHFSFLKTIWTKNPGCLLSTLGTARQNSSPMLAFCWSSALKWLRSVDFPLLSSPTTTKRRYFPIVKWRRKKRYKFLIRQFLSSQLIDSRICTKRFCGSMTFWYGFGSVSLTIYSRSGSGSCYFRHWSSRRQLCFSKFFRHITFWRYTKILFQR